jgi:uncharacterized protein YfdQ (DUF2303 family)
MSDVNDIAELALNAHIEKFGFVKNEDGREYLVMPDDHKCVEVTLPNALPYKAPHFVAQRVALQTTDSLVEYVNRYRGDDTVLFADISTDTIIGQVDYHSPGDEELVPRPVAHAAALKLAFSVEWTAWNGISGKLMDQLDFARFIEENACDVRAPCGAEILECVRHLQAVRKVDWRKAVRTASGVETFEYAEATEAKTKGGVEVPTKFLLGIPVYFGEPDHELHAFLRWKLDGGDLKIGVQLHRPEHVRQAVFKNIVYDVAERVKCPAMYGKLC